MSTPARLALRAILTMLLVYAMARTLPQYIQFSGGLIGIVTVGALLSLLNMFLRPVLNIITFPLKLVATIVAIILANAAFLWAVLHITSLMDPEVVGFAIKDGLEGWLVVSLIIGVANWILKELLHPKNS